MNYGNLGNEDLLPEEWNIVTWEVKCEKCEMTNGGMRHEEL